jgi:microcystin degradation protein MlrC
MVDPDAANHLNECNVGDTLTIEIGGKTDPRFGGGPLTVTGTILGLSDGICVGDGPMKNGQTIKFGPTAVLRVDGIDILVVNEPIQMYDQQQFRAFGIDLDAKSVIGLKSMQHFRAAFEPLTETVIVCDSGALCTPDASKLPYRNVPRPIFPLDPDMKLDHPA